MAGKKRKNLGTKKKSGTEFKKDLLQNWLVRTAYLNSLFGVNNFDELQRWLSEVDEGLDNTDGHTYFYHNLRGIKNFKDGNIGQDKLAEYDYNICGHMKQINANRETPIRLKYYQWLAALYTEAYLDKFFTEGEGKFGGELEKSAYNFIENKQLINDDIFLHYVPSRKELSKCGYWMATGSGKTFLIHLNYLQFIHYNKGPFKKDIDRVILVTPSANLTAQHLREFKKSGIAAVEFNPNSLDGYFSGNNGLAINVIETTKLIENKSDGGKKRVDVSAFGSKNLVFVDEAHKGSSVDKEKKSGWKYLRDIISSEGWTFEYSATFGQAAEGTDEYKNNGIFSKTFTSFAKTILYDYSYRHFYNDGYGKEYRVLNVDEKNGEANRVLLGNLLTFYEQKLVYFNNKKLANDYNIEEPLWIFVGNTVNGKSKSSDVLTVLSFFNKFLKEKDWAIQTISDFLMGNSGLLDSKEPHNDLFAPEFPEQRLRYLREQKCEAKTLYKNILDTVFRCSSVNELCLSRLKDTDGEIGIKCGDNPFFAEIYIGDADAFIKTVTEKIPNIYIESISHNSLFKSIDFESSTLNILIGAKKFIEGWDCYRVSCMGLLNVGASEGTEIIQLFGRGIRLRGRNYSLKRSTYKNMAPNRDFPILETLNIFGVNAKYVGQLRNYFKHDGIDLENTVETEITINRRDDFLISNLLIPNINKDGFTSHEYIIFTLEDIWPPISVDLRSFAEIEDSDNFTEGVKTQIVHEPVVIDNRFLEYLDWTKIYFSLLDFKTIKGWYNVIFTEELLEKIIRNNRYVLYCPKELITPVSFSEMNKLESVVILILKKSLQAAYSKKLNKYIYLNADVTELKSNHNNFRNYTIRIKESEDSLIKLIEEINLIFNTNPFNNGHKYQIISASENNSINLSIDNRGNTLNKSLITDIWSDRHLFYPLLAKIPDSKKELMVISPSGLNEGEQEFVLSIEKFVKDVNNTEYFKTHQFYLLRNLPKEGIGFYDTAWFYPDFLLWIKDLTTGDQRLIFADPKGLVHLSEGFENEKVKLYQGIKLLEKSLNLKLHSSQKLTLDSYIISNTPIADLKGIFGTHTIDEYAKHHILFWKTDYINRIIFDE